MGTGRWIGVLLVALTAACGGHSVREPPGGAAGSSSTVHPTPTDPTPIDDPEPIDDPAPIEDPEPDDPEPPEMNTPKPLPVPCEYESLDVICSSGNCPATPDSFGDQCAKGLSVSRTGTVCGGTVVVNGFSFGQTSYFFDATGALTGVISIGDVEERCGDGHATNARVYGEACPVSGILLDACETSVTCGAPYMCVPGPTCPLHAADVLANYCSDPSTEVVRAWSTTCGSMLTVSRTTDEVRYCYDAQDQLTGIATLKISDNSWSVLGTDCRTTEQRGLPCVPK